MKYFEEKEEQKEKVLISEYVKELKEETSAEGHFIQDEYDLRVGKYLKLLLGDQEIDKSLFKEFIKFYSRFGGKYSVISDDETIIGLKELKDEYGLTTEAISDLGLYYIKDLFDTYSLDKLLKDFIDEYGREDETFEKYIEFVDKIGDIYQEQFEQEAESLEYLEEEYGKKLKEYLQTQIIRHHYHKEDLLKYLPESSLIKKDEEQLLDFATKSRIHFGLCYPMSYQLIVEMMKDDELSTYPEELHYSSSFGKTIPLTFTKSDFIDSTMKKQKIR